MNYFDLYSSYPDRTIAAAWDSQVKETDQTPWLAGTLTECGGELFARFAACYAELRALPRGARRALQRRIARSAELAAILPEYFQGGRGLQRRLAWSLAGAALLLALGQGVSNAATITVTTNNPYVISDGQCSLIEAIVNANNDAATYPDCPAGSGADTIVLPANANLALSAVYARTYGQFGDPVGLPPITSRITIEGNGATIARQANAPDFGLIFVKGNSFGSPGGTSGDLTLRSLTLAGGSSFGGLWSTGTLTIKDSIISGNTGSGVSNSGTLTIENSIISGNSGSGVSNGGTLTIENSTISGNTNGGVINFNGTLIENSTISGNTTNFIGGGVLNYGTLTIKNSTISGNRADRGGGISNSQYCYFGCSSGILTLNNSLIAGNQATAAPEIDNTSIVNANNFNLFGVNGNAGVSGFGPGPTDIVPSVPLAQILRPLKNNGGPTQTLALVAGSPAIDAGDPGGCRDNSGALLQTDQRGFPRNVDGNNDGAARCDIGAVEGIGPAALVDFDGDSKSDIALYRDGIWYVIRSSDGAQSAIGLGGMPQDIPVPGDYDGDGKTDIAVYRDGTWFIKRSSDEGITTTVWGGMPQDIPVPGDYDGDGKTDIAVYRDGTWFIRRSSDNLEPVIIWGGAPQDIPVPGDYDGDGKTDIALYRDGTWFIRRSSDNLEPVVVWGGAPQDIPVPRDYDGDGKTDIAVYRDGTWFIKRSSDNLEPVIIWGGMPQDMPVPADYDGDGKTDIAVYRDGTWFIKRSSDEGLKTIVLGGAPQDIPLK
jgi:parallel beta helix pectate lyase-like protein/VCBS repeat protein